MWMEQMVTSDGDVLAVGECRKNMTGQLWPVAPLYDQAKVGSFRR